MVLLFMFLVNLLMFLVVLSYKNEEKKQEKLRRARIDFLIDEIIDGLED